MTLAIALVGSVNTTTVSNNVCVKRKFTSSMADDRPHNGSSKRPCTNDVKWFQPYFDDYVEQLRIKDDLHNFPMNEHGNARRNAVQWIFAACIELNYGRHIAFTAVHYLDMSLMRFTDVLKLDMIECAATCLLISTKMEGVQFIEVQDIVRIGNRRFTRANLLARERELLALMEFKLIVITPLCWYTLWKCDVPPEIDNRFDQVCTTLLFLAMTEQSVYYSWKPSVVAAASMLVASVVLHAPQHNYARYAKCTPEQICRCGDQLLALLAKTIRDPEKISSVARSASPTKYSRLISTVRDLKLVEKNGITSITSR